MSHGDRGASEGARRRVLLAVAGLSAAACAPIGRRDPDRPFPVAEAIAPLLAPGGELRAAINFGNPILASREPGSGAPRGVSVDLARELARRLDRPLRLVTFESAGQVNEAVRRDAWDLAFLAVDPARATEIRFSAPYVMIEGAYLVRDASPIRENDQVDRAGHRVVVGRGSAYDLYLSRELRQAQLVRASTSPAVTDLMMAQGLDVAAGVRQQLLADAQRHPGTRVLPGRFMVIHQAMGIPQTRDPRAARYVDTFIAQMKRTGFIERALRTHGIDGASVAP